MEVRTVKVSPDMPAADLLSMARRGPVLVETPEGDSFVISHADDLASEVELLRRNHAFLAMLDRLKEDDEHIPLEEAEAQLGQ